MSEMSDLMAMLSLADYAEQVAGKSLRTVQRWLEKDELPGAEQDDEGRWWVPATARRRTSSRDVVAARQATSSYDVVPVSSPAVSPLGMLVSLEQAAEVLGTKAGRVRQMGRDGLLTVGPYGPNGALRVWLPPTGAR